MRAQPNLSVATPDTIRSVLLEAVEGLLASLKEGVGLEEELNYVRMLVDSLPLASDAHATASNRLRNTQRYLALGELGAARYELRLLAGSLRAEPVSTHRARRLGVR